MSGIDGRKEDLERVYDRISADFNRTRKRPWPQTLNFIATIKENSRVLDIGCGNGRDTILLLENGHKVTAVDISENQCRTTYENVKEQGLLGSLFSVIQADCEQLPFGDGSFNTALFMATLHHLDSKDARVCALKELKRCLEEGGRALISVWDYAQPRFESLYERQLIDHDRDDGMTFGDVEIPWKNQEDGRTYQRFYHLFLEEEFSKLVLSIGFKDAKIFSESGNHFAEITK